MEVPDILTLNSICDTLILEDKCMELYEDYLKENYLIKTKKQMAQELNLTYHQIDVRLRKLKLSHYKSNSWTQDEIDILKELYPNPTNTKEIICKALPNHRWSAIQKQASKLGYIRQWAYNYICSEGYLVDCKDRDNKKLIHRLIYEQTHNCVLTSADIIHHKDGNKLNNSPDNLVKLTRAEHMNLHRKDLKIKR